MKYQVGDCFRTYSRFDGRVYFYKIIEHKIDNRIWRKTRGAYYLAESLEHEYIGWLHEDEIDNTARKLSKLEKLVLFGEYMDGD